MNTILREKVWVKRGLITILSCFSILSFAKIISLHGEGTVVWGYKYFGYNITAVILTGVTAWLLNRCLLRGNRRLHTVGGILGACFSAAIVYGAYAHYVNNIFMSAGESLQQAGLVLGIAMLTIPAAEELLLWLERVNRWYGKKQKEQAEKKSSGRFGKIKIYFEKHPAMYFLAAWAFIFIAYMPLFLAWWPGNFIFDGKYQLQNVVENSYSTHHPLLHTLLMGKAYEFGKALGDVSFGYQFYTLLQMLVLSSSFAYLLLFLHKKKAPGCFRTGVLLWYAFFPMHSLFSISSTKDVLCAAFFLFFMVFMLRLIWEKETFRWYSYAGMIVSGVLLCLFRNNAVYAVLATGLLLCIFVKGMKTQGRLLLVFLPVIVLAQILNQGLIAYTHARQPDTYKETLSMPLQSLARVASYRHEDLDPAVYEEICLYMQKEDIAGYQPYLADSVKNNANEQLLKDNLPNFLKLWLKVGIQYPDEYLESIITNTMGYWYPLNQGTYVSMDIALYHTLIGVGDEIVKQNYCGWANKLYSDLFWTGHFQFIPVLGFSFRNAVYFWVTVFYIFWCLYKKDKRGLALGCLPVMYLLTCFLGPVAALRYIYCIVVCAPLLLYVVFSGGQQKAGEGLEGAAKEQKVLR